MATRTGVVRRPNETNFVKQKKIMTVKARRAIDKMAYKMSDLSRAAKSARFHCTVFKSEV
jgi:hypothetical protein